jgi:hypothetical protein
MLLIYAFLAGLFVWILDLFILDIIGLIMPFTADWLDEALIGLFSSVLIYLSFIKYKQKFVPFLIIPVAYLGYQLIPALYVTATIDTFKAEISTAGLNEIKGGKKTIWLATVTPVDEHGETETEYRAQDAYVLPFIYWWHRSGTTRAQAEKAMRKQTVVCVTEYGNRWGFPTIYPNLVAVKPVETCD